MQEAAPAYQMVPLPGAHVPVVFLQEVGQDKKTPGCPATRSVGRSAPGRARRVCAVQGCGWRWECE